MRFDHLAPCRGARAQSLEPDHELADEASVGAQPGPAAQELGPAFEEIDDSGRPGVHILHRAQDRVVAAEAVEPIEEVLAVLERVVERRPVLIRAGGPGVCARVQQLLRRVQVPGDRRVDERRVRAACGRQIDVGAARDQERQQPGVVVVHGQVDRRPAGGLGVHIRALVDQLAYPLVIGGEDVGVYRPVVARELRGHDCLDVLGEVRLQQSARVRRLAALLALRQRRLRPARLLHRHWCGAGGRGRRPKRCVSPVCVWTVMYHAQSRSRGSGRLRSIG